MSFVATVLSKCRVYAGVCAKDTASQGQGQGQIGMSKYPRALVARLRGSTSCHAVFMLYRALAGVLSIMRVSSLVFVCVYIFTHSYHWSASVAIAVCDVVLFAGMQLAMCNGYKERKCSVGAVIFLCEVLSTIGHIVLLCLALHAEHVVMFWVLCGVMSAHRICLALHTRYKEQIERRVFMVPSSLRHWCCGGQSDSGRRTT